MAGPRKKIWFPSLVSHLPGGPIFQMPAVSFWGVYTFWVNISDRNPSCVYLEAIDDFLFCLEFLGHALEG